MKKNMSNIDQAVRMFLALAIIGLHVFTPWVSGIMIPILVVFGLALIATSIVGFCPMYSLIGVNTNYKRPV
jgi:fatty acid desaturase